MPLICFLRESSNAAEAALPMPLVRMSVMVGLLEAVLVWGVV